MNDDALRDMIKSWRKRFGWSQDAVAFSLGMAQNQYSRYETGKSAIPVNLLQRLARLYGRELVIDFRYPGEPA